MVGDIYFQLVSRPKAQSVFGAFPPLRTQQDAVVQHGIAVPPNDGMGVVGAQVSHFGRGSSDRVHLPHKLNQVPLVLIRTPRQGNLQFVNHPVPFRVGPHVERHPRPRRCVRDGRLGREVIPRVRGHVQREGVARTTGCRVPR